MLPILIFVVSLFFLVLVHEFGHFIIAKKFGIKVLEFGFGIPPRVWGKTIGETIVSINWLPFGGFVRLLGENETDPEALGNKRSFASKPVWQRIGVVVGGVAVNLLVAVVIFTGIIAHQGFEEKVPLLISYQFAGVTQRNESVILIGEVAPDSPAAWSGVKPGDRIISLDGQRLDSVEQLVNYSKEHAGQAVKFTLLDPSETTRELVITPRRDPPSGQGPLGIQLGSITMAILSYETPLQKIASGVIRSYNFTTYSFNILGRLISQSIAERNIEPVSQTVAGPVGIAGIYKNILDTQNPILPILNFLGLLSLNLAVFNILPFPALDGGRLFFLLIEAFFRRKVRAEVENFIHNTGMAILIGLTLLVAFSDIKKLF